MPAQPSRRQLLLSVGAVTVGLAACTKHTDASAPTSTPATPTTGTSAATPAPTASASPTAKATYGQLAGKISGGLVQPGDAAYNAGGLLYNTRFAKQAGPAAIARCRTAQDVAACVAFAASTGTSLRVRNGGHSYGGWSSSTGLVANIASLNAVTVDTTTMTATVGAGAVLADVYSALAAKGVSIAAGSCPTVGISGLTLGGGVGVLSRAYGLTCDQVRSAQLVTADGKVRNVDAHTDADLFWALRGGGGGSFGAVTSWTFAVRPAPTITTFFLQWPGSAAETVLAAWQNWIATQPRELWSTCKILADPGSGVKTTVSGTWIGSGAVSTRLRSLLSNTPEPGTNTTGSGSYGATMLSEAGCRGEDAQSCLTEALTPAKRQPFAASSSILAKPLPAAGISAIVAKVNAGETLANLVEGGVSFDSLGGAVADVEPAASAFPWRTALAAIQYTATWANASTNSAPFDAFVRSERAALAPWLGASAYVNYADPSITDYATAYWGSNSAKLSQVKRTYDPHELFTFPQAVKPA